MGREAKRFIFLWEEGKRRVIKNKSGTYYITKKKKAPTKTVFDEKKKRETK